MANVTRYYYQMVSLQFIWRYIQGRNHINAANVARHILKGCLDEHMNLHSGEKPQQWPFIWEHSLAINYIIKANVTIHFHQMVILQFLWKYTQGRNHINAAIVAMNFRWGLSWWTHEDAYWWEAISMHYVWWSLFKK